MKFFFKILFVAAVISASSKYSIAQLVITSQSNALTLAQKLVGNGVTISNATLVSAADATGFFNNVSGAKLNIDSGIVLTNGRAKSQGVTAWGLDGNGITIASGALATLDNHLQGDGDIAR